MLRVRVFLVADLRHRSLLSHRSLWWESFACDPGFHWRAAVLVELVFQRAHAQLAGLAAGDGLIWALVERHLGGDCGDGVRVHGENRGTLRAVLDEEVVVTRIHLRHVA